MPRRLDPKVVDRIMLKAQLKPQEPYKTSHAKWKCKCLICGKTVFPRLYSLQAGKGGCKYCAARKRQLHFKMLDKEAIRLARKAKVVPLEPYVNMLSKWKSKCLICGQVVFPRLADMKRHPNSLGCKRCANNDANSKLKLSEKKAISVMQKGGLRPLTPYVNANKPWKCRCLECGRTISPSLNAVRDGGGCRYCAESGFKLNLPSYLYLVTHQGVGAHKVGIANKDRRVDRLRRLNNYGWKTCEVWDFESGTQARKCETRIFKVIRKDLGIPIFLQREQLPITQGYTETMDANKITVKSLKKLIEREVGALGNNP